MIGVFSLSVCCGCSHYWELISLISSNNEDTINSVIINYCDDNKLDLHKTTENIKEHIHYGKRSDKILNEDYQFNYWFVVEEVDVIN
jgi:hypothetical protein